MVILLDMNIIFQLDRFKSLSHYFFCILECCFYHPSTSSHSLAFYWFLLSLLLKKVSTQTSCLWPFPSPQIDRVSKSREKMKPSQNSGCLTWALKQRLTYLIMPDSPTMPSSVYFIKNKSELHLGGLPSFLAFNKGQIKFPANTYQNELMNYLLS